ncbi:MAG: HU family DNA-binding protein [Planctomycetota bacterium]|nr:HU family DNA-binding protein [Planctomycetota bacterium]
MNKRQLIDYVAREVVVSREDARRILDVVLAGVRYGLTEDGNVGISGFGTFEVKPRKARTLRNPRTGDPIEVAAGNRVGFRVSKLLRESFQETA